MPKRFHIVPPTREENVETKKNLATSLKRKFQKTYINVMSKVVFITSKAEREAANLAINHVTFKVFTASKAEREAASLAIKHVKVQVSPSSQ